LCLERRGTSRVFLGVAKPSAATFFHSISLNCYVLSLSLTNPYGVKGWLMHNVQSSNLKAAIVRKVFNPFFVHKCYCSEGMPTTCAGWSAKRDFQRLSSRLSFAHETQCRRLLKIGRLTAAELTPLSLVLPLSPSPPLHFLFRHSLLPRTV
jgi:hypothetical protein